VPKISFRRVWAFGQPCLDRLDQVFVCPACLFHKLFSLFFLRLLLTRGLFPPPWIEVIFPDPPMRAGIFLLFQQDHGKVSPLVSCLKFFFFFSDSWPPAAFFFGPLQHIIPSLIPPRSRAIFLLVASPPTPYSQQASTTRDFSPLVSSVHLILTFRGVFVSELLSLHPLNARERPLGVLRFLSRSLILFLRLESFFLVSAVPPSSLLPVNISGKDSRSWPRF